MTRHAAMNRIYRLVWSRISNTWVAVAETSKGRGKSARRKLLATVILGTLLPAAHPALATTLSPNTLPSGGNIVSGSGSIATTGNALTVTQSSQRLIAEWQSYNIGSAASVTYLQPSSSAIALNRVLGVDPSVIMGRLNANGQVFLINAAGVTFAPARGSMSAASSPAASVSAMPTSTGAITHSSKAALAAPSPIRATSSPAAALSP